MLPKLDQIKVIKVNPIRMDTKDFTTPSDKIEEKECKKWKLTKVQIVRFFRLSINYSYSPYSLYSQTQCDITGKLIYNRKEWGFSINGGATAFWERGKETKYFGCKDKRCDNLFIISYTPLD